MVLLVTCPNAQTAPPSLKDDIEARDSMGYMVLPTIKFLFHTCVPRLSLFEEVPREVESKETFHACHQSSSI